MASKIGFIVKGSGDGGMEGGLLRSIVSSIVTEPDAGVIGAANVSFLNCIS